MNSYDCDESEGPLAFLITFRTYGTWLHGDDRFSVDRHGRNIYGTPKIAPNERLSGLMLDKQNSSHFVLDGPQRGVVERAILDVCKIRGFGLAAINVRTNHVHTVVSASKKPESIISAFKSNATRELRAAGLVDQTRRVWSRGGSRRYLWKPNHVEGAVEYVLHGQGHDLPNF